MSLPYEWFYHLQNLQFTFIKTPSLFCHFPYIVIHTVLIYGVNIFSFEMHSQCHWEVVRIKMPVSLYISHTNAHAHKLWHTHTHAICQNTPTYWNIQSDSIKNATLMFVIFVKIINQTKIWNDDIKEYSFFCNQRKCDQNRPNHSQEDGILWRDCFLLFHVNM